MQVKNIVCASRELIHGRIDMCHSAERFQIFAQVGSVAAGFAEIV